MSTTVNRTGFAVTRDGGAAAITRDAGAFASTAVITGGADGEMTVSNAAPGEVVHIGADADGNPTLEVVSPDGTISTYDAPGEGQSVVTPASEGCDAATTEPASTRPGES